MFIICEIKETIKIPPKDIGNTLEDIIVDEIDTNYNNKVIYCYQFEDYH